MERLNKYQRFDKFIDLEENDQKAFLSDIMTIAAEFKGISCDCDELIKAAKYILYFIKKKFKHFTIANIITALEMGMAGEYKSYAKVNADLIINWFTEFNKQLAGEIYSSSVQTPFDDGSNKDPEELRKGRLAGQAVALRLKYDRDWKISNRDNIKLDDIVAAIEKGINIFTGKKYIYETLESGWLNNMERTNGPKRIGYLL